MSTPDTGDVTPPPVVYGVPLETDSNSDSNDAYMSYLYSTSSVDDSVTNYVREYGRSYHRYKDGSYILPCDEPEKDRLDRRYALNKFIWDGNIHHAPLANPHKILDLGTGTGIWPMEMAELYPDCHITGTDLSAIQPNIVPPNVHFEIDDASESDWGRPLNSFDFVRMSYLLGCFSSYQSVMRTAYQHLVPGSGWIECIELDPMPRADDDSLATAEAAPGGYAFAEHMNRLEEAATEWTDPPKSIRIAHRMSTWMRQVGYVDVHESIYKIPISPWPKDKKLKLAGRVYEEICCDGMAGYSYRLLGQMGMNKEEMEVLLVDVRKAVRRRDVHAWNALHVVWGRRPTEEEERRNKAEKERDRERKRRARESGISVRSTGSGKNRGRR
ncbi:MAG: hypothetical protein Q9160_006460 [Pyrenula sp. 1 TL-2023]